MADELDGSAEALTEDDLARAFEEADDDAEDSEEIEAAADDGDSDDEPEEGKEDEPAEEEPPKGRYKVVVKNDDGSTSEQSVSFDELKAGYQRAKEAEVVRGQAEQQVLTVQQEAVKHVQATRAEFDKEFRSLDMLVAQALEVVSPENLLTLSQTDRDAYIAAFQRQQSLVAVRDRIKAAQAQAAQVVEQQEMQARMKQAERARAELTKAGISGTQVDSIYEKAKEFGFSPQELVQNLDHRLVVVLKDALELRALKAKKPQVTEKLRTAPKLPPSKTQTPRSQPNADLMKRLRTKATGKDLAAYFASQG